MTRLWTFLISLLATLATVFGCGVIPQGQARTISFTVSGFKLPVAMVSTSSTSAPAQFPGIASTPGAANSFVMRLIMQTVIDVLEQQGRNAGLPGAIISMILSQLTTQISYAPLECKTVSAFQPGPTRTISFTVSGFKLPVAMVFTTSASAPSQFPGVGITPGALNSFVMRLIMQTVIDVLEQQGRRAGLPDV
ncbi:hypothetical protein KIN20_001977 [Parelaphostrongylus tenuis]|uniref:Lipoprotein n=1 Tax=Parelaphostrongylus tenuis TaxID=148309 RepID=A0AAD5QD74_PARTN|nr:hypothetical protein KIN20_001977 [Parelaphostrongylus tenuis]